MENISITSIVRFFEHEKDVSKFSYRFLFYLISQKSCELTNKELATHFTVSDELIKKTVSDMKKRELIEVTSVNNCRTIKPSVKLLNYFNNKQNRDSLVSQIQPVNALTIEGKRKPKQSANGEMLSDEDMAVKEVVEYLNLKTGKKFNHKARASYKDIRARLKEGYTVDQMKHAVNVKVEQWTGNDKYERYLRPETLFGNKLENYINEKTNGSNWLDIDLEQNNPLLNFEKWKNEQVQNNPTIEDENTSELPF